MKISRTVRTCVKSWAGMPINSPKAAQRMRTKRRTLITKSLQKKGAIPSMEDVEMQVNAPYVPTLDDFHTRSIPPTPMVNETTKVSPSDWSFAMLETTDRRVHSEISSHVHVS